MKIKRTLFIFITTIALLFNCGKSDETYTIETKDGVNYVHNYGPLWGDEQKISMEFVRQIGELEGKDEKYLLYKPLKLIRDSYGNFYILDWGNYRVQKYDPDVKYLATFGRKGQGPGEFQSPGTIQLDSKDNLYVREQRIKGNIIVFNQDRREIRRITLENSSAYDFLVLQSDKIIAPVESDTALLGIFDADGKINKQFVERKSYSRDAEIKTQVSISFLLIANRFASALDKKDNIYLVFCIQNRIEKYSKNGVLIFKSDRNLNYGESTEARIEKRMVSLFVPGEEPSEKVEMDIPVYNIIYSFSGIGIDNKGRLWTATYMHQPDPDKEEELSDYMQFEIFDSDGILLCYLPLPEKFTKNFTIYDDRIYFIDSENEHCVYEYKIIEK